MDRLQDQFDRLFLMDGVFPGEAAVQPAAEVLVRLLVLGVRGPADWPTLAAVWRGVQADLDLPAPAIAVNGVDAFELWFSLSDPLRAETGAAFLGALCHRYLAEVAPARCRLWPSPDPGLQVEPARIPQWHTETARWSAFVAPDLAAVFGDDPSLDIPPGDDAQADLLSRLRPVSGAEFQLAMAQLTPEPSPFLPVIPSQRPAVVSGPAPAGTLHRHDDPRQFLLEVMNDSSVTMALRIEAAKALL